MSRSRIGVLAVVLLLIGATVAGVAYRRWVFEFTVPGRHQYDIRRNFNFGWAALEVGFLNIYEDQLRDNLTPDLKLDYPPLRLGVFTAWAAVARWTHPEVDVWQPEWSFHAFLMWHNIVLAWLGSLAAFLIVRHWLREVARAELPVGHEPTATVGLLRGTLAFLVLWFDPGVALIAHGWPSPNMWAIPYYLWAVYLCLKDRWFLAGLVLAVGAMLQGQMLIVACVFVLWPLFGGRPTRAFRLSCGFVLALALTVSGWMVTIRPDRFEPLRLINWTAVVWVVGATGLAALLMLGKSKWRLLPGLAAVGLACWPVSKLGWPATGITSVAVLLVVVAIWLRWRERRYLLAGMAAGLLLACIPVFNATTAWWKVGFLYGAERFPLMTIGPTTNLPAILDRSFRWHYINETALTLPQQMVGSWPAAPMTVSIKLVLVGSYFALLVVGSIAIAIQWRRRDRNLLVALVLPWLLFYTLCPQVIARYAVYVAGVGAIVIGRGVAMWLPIAFFSFLTVMQTYYLMIGAAMYRSESQGSIFNGTAVRSMDRYLVGMSWAVMVITALFLWTAFRRSQPASTGLGDQRLGTDAVDVQGSKQATLEQ